MKRKKAKDSIEFHGKTVPLAAIGEMDYGDQNEILSKRGNAIQYIEEPTEEQKLIAVKQNGYAIRYIDSPSYELQRISVMQQATAIQFISTPYPDLVDYAFQKDPNVLAFIKDPLSRGELTADVSADYLRNERISDCAFVSENARCQQSAGTLSEEGLDQQTDHNKNQAARYFAA